MRVRPVTRYLPRDVFLVFTVFSAFAGWPSGVSAAAALSFCFLVITARPLCRLHRRVRRSSGHTRDTCGAACGTGAAPAGPEPDHHRTDTHRHDAECDERGSSCSPVVAPARATQIYHQVLRGSKRRRRPRRLRSAGHCSNPLCWGRTFREAARWAPRDDSLRRSLRRRNPKRSSAPVFAAGRRVPDPRLRAVDVRVKGPQNRAPNRCLGGAPQVTLARTMLRLLTAGAALALAASLGAGQAAAASAPTAATGPVTAVGPRLPPSPAA